MAGDSSMSSSSLFYALYLEMQQDGRTTPTTWHDMKLSMAAE
jgi:hypothetical protein